MIHFHSRNRLTPRRSTRHRGGVTLIELVISAMVLVTIMSFITSICLHVSLVWKDIGHHRAAVNELSNQLEHLTQLSLADATQALKSLQPTETCARTLDSPELTGELISDELGIRVVLQLNWKRRHPGKPIELAGWMTSEILAEEDDSTGKNANHVVDPRGQTRQVATYENQRRVTR